MTDRRIFDPGLQPERTELAWRRTALAICVGSLLSMRILPTAVPEPIGGPAWIVPGLLGLGFAGSLWAIAHRRQLRCTRALIRPGSVAVPGGAPLLALTAFVLACGALSVVLALLPSAPVSPLFEVP
jgi:putative membrane protein